MTKRKRPPALKAPARHTTLHPDDVELFRRSVADAIPLAPHDKVAVRKSRVLSRRRIQHAPRSAADDLSDYSPFHREPGSPLDFSRPGVQRQVLRRLRSGSAAVESELDLHGLTVTAARPMLVAFLNACAREGIRRVRIVHGKGLRSSGGEGVLKGMVASWLAQRDDVLAFREAPASGGGGGAVIVLLRAR